jgi:hypothetical protein
LAPAPGSSSGSASLLYSKVIFGRNFLNPTLSLGYSIILTQRLFLATVKDAIETPQTISLDHLLWSLDLGENGVFSERTGPQLQGVSAKISSLLWETDNLGTDVLQLGTNGGFNEITFSCSWANRLGYSYSVFGLQYFQWGVLNIDWRMLFSFRRGSTSSWSYCSRLSACPSANGSRQPSGSRSKTASVSWLISVSSCPIVHTTHPYTIVVKMVDFLCPQVAWQVQTQICFPAVKQGLILE